MDATPKQIVYYQETDGKVPFILWYNDLCDTKVKEAVDKRLERVTNGNYGDCESVGGSVLELRFKAFGVRIYFAEVEKVLVVLLCAGDKSSQVKDIAKAKEYWIDYCSHIEEV